MSYQLRKVLAGAVSALVGLFIAGGAALAQNGTKVSGTVVDDFGEPLIGASVTVEGVTPPVGAVTDLDGRYEIR